MTFVGLEKTMKDLMMLRFDKAGLCFFEGHEYVVTGWFLKRFKCIRCKEEVLCGNTVVKKIV